ncbi:MAG: Hpt domain-containing protein [Desulfobacteraceae bacterium]
MMDQDELVKVCVRESQAHLESINSGVLAIQEKNYKIDYDELQITARSVRSIKGACSFYGFQNISRLARQMENLLLQIQERKTQAGSGLVNALLTGVGALKDMLDDVGKSEAYPIDPALSLLEKYAALAGEFEKKITVREIPRQGKKERAFEINEADLTRFVQNNQFLYTLTFFFKEDLTGKGKNPFDVINTINSCGELIESTLDVHSIHGLSDCLENDISFVALFATDMAKERIGRQIGIPQSRVCPIDMTDFLPPRQDAANNDILYLTPETDLVASHIEALRTRFLKKLKENPAVSKVVLQADHIEEMDSLGVNLIIGIYRQVDSESKSFEITGAGEKFLKVAEFFRFPALFRINSEDNTP